MIHSHHTVFIDESGEREYGQATSAYFVYLGCIVERQDIERVESAIRQIKRAYLKTENVEFKSNWFRIPKERMRRYLTPFRITETVFREMTSEVYRVIRESPIVLIASVIDKKGMIKKYEEKAFSPSGFAYELLMQRYQYFLQDSRSIGDVIIDDISGKNPRGHRYKELIRSLHGRLQRYGTTGQKVRVDRVLGEPRFWPSEKSNIIQIADFCAYNTMRQFRDFDHDIESLFKRDDFRGYGPFLEIAPRFRSDSEGRIRGYGIARFPERLDDRL